MPFRHRNKAAGVMPLFKLRIEAADLDAGRSAAGHIGEVIAPEPLAVTLFEARPPAVVVEAYYTTPPNLAGLGSQLAAIAGLGPPTLEAVPDCNWVTLSQAALPPVESGRPTLSGSHPLALLDALPIASLQQVADRP